MTNNRSLNDFALYLTNLNYTENKVVIHGIFVHLSKINEEIERAIEHGLVSPKATVTIYADTLFLAEEEAMFKIPFVLNIWARVVVKPYSEQSNVWVNIGDRFLTQETFYYESDAAYAIPTADTATETRLVKHQVGTLNLTVSVPPQDVSTKWQQNKTICKEPPRQIKLPGYVAFSRLHMALMARAVIQLVRSGDAEMSGEGKRIARFLLMHGTADMNPVYRMVFVSVLEAEQEADVGKFVFVRYSVRYIKDLGKEWTEAVSELSYEWPRLYQHDRSPTNEWSSLRQFFRCVGDSRVLPHFAWLEKALAMVRAVSNSSEAQWTEVKNRLQASSEYLKGLEVDACAEHGAAVAEEDMTSFCFILTNCMKMDKLLAGPHVIHPTDMRPIHQRYWGMVEGYLNDLLDKQKSDPDNYLDLDNVTATFVKVTKTFLKRTKSDDPTLDDAPELKPLKSMTALLLFVVERYPNKVSFDNTGKFRRGIAVKNVGTSIDRLIRSQLPPDVEHAYDKEINSYGARLTFYLQVSEQARPKVCVSICTKT